MDKFFSGKARYLVSIEQLAGTQDSTGQEIKTWNLFVRAWASIEQIGGSERMATHQVFAGVTAKIKMRWQDGIVPKMRVTYNLRHWDIISSSDPDGRRRWLDLMCTERVESGQAGE